MTTPVNDRESSLIVINSKYRSKQSASTSDFIYNIGQSINVAQYSIKSISLTNAQTNVNQYNNTIAFTTATVDYATTIPVGQYTTTELLTAIQTAVSAVSATVVTITFAQSALTNQVTITWSAPTIMTVAPYVASEQRTNNSLWINVGYPATTADLAVQLAPNVPSLQGTYNYYIRSTEIGSKTRFSNNLDINILDEVPNREAYGGQIIHNPNDWLFGLKKYQTPKPIQDIDITVLDHNYNVVDLHGTDVEIVLKLFAKE